MTQHTLNPSSIYDDLVYKVPEQTQWNIQWLYIYMHFFFLHRPFIEKYDHICHCLKV